MITSLKQRKIKFEPRIKLNHNIDILLCQLSSWHWNILHFFCLFSASLLVLKISGFLVYAQNREVKTCQSSSQYPLFSGVTTGQPEIWFLDRSLEWWYLASSFTDYFRMMIVHLCIPLWQLSFYCNRSKSRNKGRHKLICDFATS